MMGNQVIAKGTRTGAEQLQDKLEELRNRGCSEEAEELCRDILTFEEEEIIRAENLSRLFGRD